jgi:hypothetical protein
MPVNFDGHLGAPRASSGGSRTTAATSYCDKANIAEELTDFLITHAPGLAKEFAASRPAQPANPATPALPAWMSAIDDGEIISTSDAAVVAGVTAQAIRDRCKNAESDGLSIGRCFVGTWFISLSMLLDDIHRTGDLHARRRAEANARKLPKLGSSKVITLTK